MNQASFAAIELPNELPLKRIVFAVNRSVLRNGLRVKDERRDSDGQIEWQLAASSGRTVQRLRWLPSQNSFQSDEAYTPLLDQIATQIAQFEHDDLEALFKELGLPFSAPQHLSSRASKRLYRVDNLIVQLWYSRKPDWLSRSSAALRALKDILPVPELIFSASSRTQAPFQVEITTCLPGQSFEQEWPKLDVAQRRAYVAQFADLMREMHKLQGQKLNALAAIDGSLPWAERCRRELQGRLSAARQAGVEQTQIEQVRAFIAKAESELDRPSLALVHNDLHLGNILVQNGKICGIIDFECAEVGGFERDGYMMLGDAVGTMMGGSSERLAENSALQVVRWLQNDYPALYNLPGAADRHMLYLMLEPELGGEINHQGRFAAWTRILNEGWIRRWLSA